MDSSDDLDPEEDGEHDTKVAHKKKNKRRKGIFFCKICNAHRGISPSRED